MAAVTAPMPAPNSGPAPSPASGDHPWAAAEKRLNRLVRAVALVEKMGNGLGTLAFTWATVVVLGGFSTDLRQDFWYATAIVFLEAFRYPTVCTSLRHCLRSICSWQWINTLRFQNIGCFGKSIYIDFFNVSRHISRYITKSTYLELLKWSAIWNEGSK